MIVEPYREEFCEYLHDESRTTGHADAMVFACSTEDVQDALRMAAAKGWQVTIQGARTGIAAGAVPRGGLILNLSRMRQIGPVRENSIKVQPGVLLAEIRAALEGTGLFFPPDPTETSASIGGMLACNASGALSYRYGPTRRWVHALQVVLPDGDLLRIARGMRADGLHVQLRTEGGRTIDGELPLWKAPAVKSAAGYFVAPNMDLVDLFIGMEGTLGVIVEAELKLVRMPSFQQIVCAFFPDEASALQFVRFARGEHAPLPCPPVAIEFFDSCALDLLRRAGEEFAAFSEIPVPPEQAHTAVCLEFHSDRAATVEAAVMAVAERMESLGADAAECWLADTPQEMEALKRFRHATPEAVNLLIDQRKKKVPGITKLGTDMSVPDDCLEKGFRMYREGLARTGLESVVFGHVGNNHVHVNILPRTLDDYTTGKALVMQWAEQVVAMGGSISAEHGVGKLKTALLEKMAGPEGLRAMVRIKTQWDPGGLLSPGNVFAAEQMAKWN